MTKKIIIGILSTVCVFVCAFGLFGCKFEGKSRDESEDKSGEENQSAEDESENKSGEENQSTEAVLAFGIEDGENSYYVDSILSFYGDEIVIPSIYNGLPVSAIGWGAFAHCSRLKSVTIPDSITVIRGEAFQDCENLESVIMGNSVNYIGGSAFYGCSSLTEIIIPSSVDYIGKLAFSYCYNLTSITIPSSVDYIGERAFSSCYNLTCITFENPYGWKASSKNISSSELADPATAAEYLTQPPYYYTWERS